ncbi:phytanoyl-CoA dioxygenase family protein [Flavobacterium sp.]|uniref:phytanoyl-CoA dioxygenase family protein n=1 Tax=Flavobacterium sp. TaxID=239 RepID=UPI0035290535
MYKNNKSIDTYKINCTFKCKREYISKNNYCHNMVNNIFKDKELELEFDKNGFVIVDFIGKDEIEFLEKKYYEIHKKNNRGFYATTFLSDLDYRKRVDEVVSSIHNPALENHFENHKNFLGSFVTKNNEPKSELGLHQDLTLVDEDKFVPINVWCPLIDINENNGALRLLKGSHRFPRTYRAPTIPFAYQEHVKLLEPYMTPMYVKAGQAVICSQSTLHDSVPNVSNNFRIVSQTFVSHKDAQFQVVFRDKKKTKQLEIYEEDTDLLKNFQQFMDGIYERPKIGRLSKTIPFDNWQPSKREMRKLLEEYCI